MQEMIPVVSVEQMIEVDRPMIEDYGVSLIQIMENAGRNLAHLARTRFLENQPAGKPVLILAGPGGNGGGAMVCARRLHNWGAKVRVYLACSANQFTGVPGSQLNILNKMGIEIIEPDATSDLPEADLLIDGLIGYSLSGSPRGTTADLIRLANRHPAPILALDIPSGMQGTTGQAFEPTIRAAATLTLALPKQGLRISGAKKFVGELYLADISVPPELYTAPNLGLTVGALFAESDIFRVF